MRLPAHRRSQILLSHNRSVGFIESVYVTVYWYVFSGVPPPLRPPQQMYTVTFTISSALYDSCQLRPCRSNKSSAVADMAEHCCTYSITRLKVIPAFKVSTFGTNRKPACHFLLVNNTNRRPLSPFRKCRGLLVKFRCLRGRCLCLKHLFGINP